MHDFTGLFLLPAMLRIRLEFALLAAMLTSTATAEGWWLGIAIVVGAMLAGRRWPAVFEPVAARSPASRSVLDRGPAVPPHRCPRRVWYVLVAAAWLGALIGFDTLRVHLQLDPLADVHAYYDAGARLNAGLPLYEQPVGTNDASFYRYPPLLAIAFRPLALLPFETAARIWEALLIGPCHPHRDPHGRPRPLDVARPRLARGADRLEPRRRPGPGRRHLPAGRRRAVGGRARDQPQGAAGAGRGLLDRPARLAIALGWFAAAMAVLGLVTFVLEPGGTIAYLSFLRLEQVGDGPQPLAVPALAAASGWCWSWPSRSSLALRTSRGSVRLARGGRAVGPREPATADVHALHAGRRARPVRGPADGLRPAPPDSP